MKKLFTGLSIVFMCCVTFLFGCGDVYANMEISIDKTQLEIYLADDVNIADGETSEDATVTDKNTEEVIATVTGVSSKISTNVVFSTQDSCVEIFSVSTLGNETTAKIRGINIGSTRIKVTTVEGNKSKYIDVVVKRKPTLMETNQSYNPVVALNNATQINPALAVIYSPSSAVSETEVTYSLLNPTDGASISEDGVLTVGNTMPSINSETGNAEFLVQLTNVSVPSLSCVISVKVVDIITSEDQLLLKVNNVELIGDIVIELNSDALLYFEIIPRTNVDEYNFEVTSSNEYVVKSSFIRDGLYTLSGVEVGQTKLTIRVTIKDNEDYEPFIFTKNVNVKTIPEAIYLNNKITTDTEFKIFDSYSNGALGTEITPSIFPSGTNDDESSILISCEDSNFSSLEWYYSDRTKIDSYLIVQNGATIYAKAVGDIVNYNDLNGMNISFSSVSYPEVKNNVIVKTYQGVDSLSITSTLTDDYFMIQQGEEKIIEVSSLDTNNNGIDLINTDLVAVGYSSNSDSIIKINDNFATDESGKSIGYSILGLESGTTQVKISSYNGIELIFNIRVYVALTSDRLVIPNSAESSSVVTLTSTEGDGDKEYDLTMFVASQISVYSLCNPTNATIETKYQTENTDSSVAYILNGKLLSTKVGTTNITSTVSGWDENGEIKQINLLIRITVVLPISSVNFINDEYIIYEPNSVGQLNTDETFIKLELDVEPYVSLESVDSIVWSSDKDGIYINKCDIYGEVIDSPIEVVEDDDTSIIPKIATKETSNCYKAIEWESSSQSESKSTIVRATITQYGREYNCYTRVVIKKAKQVTNIIVDNLVKERRNDDDLGDYEYALNFDARKGFGDDADSFTLNTSTEPEDAKNKKLIYFILNKNEETGEYVLDESVASVTKNGIVTPMSSGKSLLIITSEDSIYGLNESNKNLPEIGLFSGILRISAFYKRILITVSDGSAENPFEIKTANDLIEINKYSENLTYHYVLTNNISMYGYTFEPIGSLNSLGFSGAISAKYNGLQFVISNLTIAQVGENIGFVSTLNEMAELNNILLTNVNITIDSLESEEDNILAGGIAGFNNGTISNCKAEGNITINSSTSMINYLLIGGIAGRNASLITADEKDNLEDTVADSTEEINFVNASFNSESYDASMNITSNVTATICGIGGISGINTDVAITENMYTNASINCENTNNVGGVVGINNGTVLACVFAGNVKGARNVGGISGVNSGDISYSSVELYNNEDITAGSFYLIAGINNVGGIAGSNNKNISLCYVRGFSERVFTPQNTIDNNSLTQYLGDIIGYECVGSIVGMNTSPAIIDQSYSIVKMQGIINLGAFAGANFGIISNSFAGSSINENMIIQNNIIIDSYSMLMDNVTALDSCYVKLSGIEYSSKGTDSEYDYLADSNFDENIWDKSTLLPTLKNNPIKLVAETLSISNYEDNINFYKVTDEDKTVGLLGLIKINNSLTTDELNAINTYKLTDLLKLIVEPSEITSLNVVVESSNINVAAVSLNGDLIMYDEGSTKITLYARQNDNAICSFILFVEKGVTDIDYDSNVELTKNISTKLNFETKAIDEVTNTQYLVNTDIKYKTTQEYENIEFDEENISLVANSEITSQEISIMPYLELSNEDKNYVVELSDKLITFDCTCLLRAREISVNSNGESIAPIDSTSLNIKMITDNNKMSDDVYDETLLFTVDGMSEKLDINAQSTIMDNKTVYTANFDRIENVNEDGLYQKTYTLEVFVNEEYKTSFTDNETFIFTFYSSLLTSNSDVTTSYKLVVVPQDLIRISMEHYPQGKGPYDKYNLEDTSDVISNAETTSNIITPGVEGYLKIDLHPIYSNLDRVELICNEINGDKISFEQMKVNFVNDKFFGFEKVVPSPAFTTSGRMILKNIDEEANIGIYYLKTYINSQAIEGSVYTITAYGYTKDKTEPLVSTYNIIVKHAPRVYATYENTETISIDVPLLCETDFDLVLDGFLGQAKDYTIKNDNSLLKLTNKERIDSVSGSLIPYTLSFVGVKTNSDDISNDNYKITSEDFENAKTLLGQTISISFNVDREVNGIIQTTKTNIDFNIVEYIISSVTIMTDTNSTMMYLGLGGAQRIHVGMSVDYALISAVNNNEYYFNMKDNYLLTDTNSNPNDELEDINIDVQTFINHLVMADNDDLVQGHDNGWSTDWDKIWDISNSTDYITLDSSKLNDTTSALNVYGVKNVSSTLINLNVRYNFVNGIPSLALETPAITPLSASMAINVSQKTSADNPSPIYNQTEFENMLEGGDYILMNDITLVDYKPLDVAISSFDGNNRVIKIQNFDLSNNYTEGALNTTTLKLGLFEEISSYTLIKNTKIDIGSITETTISAEEYTTVYFGFMAGINYGIINNSEVINSSTLQVSLTLNNSTNLVGKSYIAMFVGTNYNNISYCKVGSINTTNTIEQSMTLSASGMIAGFVAQNNKNIYASFVSGIKLVNTTNTATDSITSGFVGINKINGDIQYSYANGFGTIASGALSYDGGALVTKGNASGFVYDNSGKISTSYSNVSLALVKSLAGGFVYKNNSGAIIKNAFSYSKIIENSSSTQLFSGADQLQENNNNGTISYCYAYEQENCIPENEDANVKLLSFTECTNAETAEKTFEGLNFYNEINNTDKVTENIFAEWKMSNTCGPILNLANYAYSRDRDVTDNESYIGDTIYKYSYSDTDFTYGNISNPIIVRNATNLIEQMNTQAGFGYVYLLVDDISFEGIDTTNLTSGEFYGSILGNGFTISDLSLLHTKVSSGVETAESFGLFKNIGYSSNKKDGSVSYINNLDLVVTEVSGSEISYVGTLAGKIKNAKLSNLNVTSTDVTSTVVGRNFVGGVAGIIEENCYIKDISSSISINAEYGSSILKTLGNEYQTSDDVTMIATSDVVAYAGGIFGAVSIDKNSVCTQLLVYGKVKIRAENAGGVIGYISATSTVSDVKFEAIQNQSTAVINQSIIGKNIAGGIVADLRGTLTLARVDFSQELMSKGNTAILTIGNNTSISNLYSSENVITGGIAGYIQNGKLDNSYNKVDVRNVKTNIAGGIVGNMSNGTISNCYTTASVYALDSSEDFENVIGGAVGKLTGTNTLYNIVAMNNWNINETMSLLPVENSVPTNTNGSFVGVQYGEINGIDDINCYYYYAATNLNNTAFNDDNYPENIEKVIYNYNDLNELLTYSGRSQAGSNCFAKFNTSIWNTQTNLPTLNLYNN